MTIIWRGAGILSLFLTAGLALLCEWIFKTKTAEYIGCLVGGVLTLLIGLGLSVPSEEEKAKGIKQKFMHHTFFFIPMPVWGVAAIGYAIYMMVR